MGGTYSTHKDMTDAYISVGKPEGKGALGNLDG